MKGCSRHITNKRANYAAHLYSLFSIGRIVWYKFLSSYAAHLIITTSPCASSWYKLSSSYAAHLSPWKGEIERGLLTYLCSIIVALTIFLPLHLFTLSSLNCLQIVSFHVVKKSEATSRECQSKSPTCSWLVKTQGFYGFVWYWLLITCAFLDRFFLLFPLLKRPKTVFFGV